MKSILVITAKGGQSFSARQRARIKQTANARFLACLSPMTAENFETVARSHDLLAFTRRAIRDFDRRLIEKLPRLQGVTVYATGYEWIDHQCLEEKGIGFSHLPDYCTEVVAEHTMAMVLAMSRRIHLSHDRSRGYCDSNVSLRGFSLHGSTLGIVGYGRIGKCFARLAENFGCITQVYDPVWPSLSSPNLEALLASSDYVVLCASHTRGAAPIIDAQTIAHMKYGSFLINPSRLQLVDHQAVVDALKQKKIAGYAVDDMVPLLQQQQPYLEPGRVLQTAHTAWYCDHAMERGTGQWVDNIIAMIHRLETSHEPI